MYALAHLAYFNLENKHKLSHVETYKLIMDLLKVITAMRGRLLRFVMRGRLFCFSLLCVRLDADHQVHLQNALEQFGACVTLRDDVNFNTGSYFANRPKRLPSPT